MYECVWCEWKNVICYLFYWYMYVRNVYNLDFVDNYMMISVILVVLFIDIEN